MDNEKERIFWLVDSEEGKAYNKVYYYRCVGLEGFLDKLEKEGKIVAIISSGNNIGFMVD